jgi:hypothetical protein
MNQLPLLTSACRSCHHFAPEGRRGGICQKLNVPVQGSWKSCSLAVSAFSSSWDNVKKLDIWETATALPKVAVAASIKEVSTTEIYTIEALSA